MAELEPQEKQELDRRTFVRAAIGAAVTVGAVAAGCAPAPTPTPPPTPTPVPPSPVPTPTPGLKLVSRFRKEIPATNPQDPAWEEAPALEVPLAVQNIAPPHLKELAVSSLKVRSLNNGTQIAFLVEWADGTKDELEAIARFRDAAAVQLPLKPDTTPPVTMGGPGAPVHILHWKASWQADIDTARKGVKDAFPNSWADLTPDQTLPKEAATSYSPGLQVGNPLSLLERASPVEEATAEGFGTLTTHKEQKAVGKGVFAGGKWKVAIGIPMQGGEGKVNLKGGQKTVVAFAAWDGGKKNVGSRKQWANWVTLEVGTG